LAKKILIIGGVAGGATAAARLRRLNEKAEIIVLEKGRYISYANCGMPYYIGGKIEDRSRLLVATPQLFKKRYNIDVRTENEAIDIYPKTKQVVVVDIKTGKKYKEKYDYLILSPGAKPFKPRIPGVEHFRVLTLRSLADTDLIKKFIENKDPKKIAIVGGGAIGVEMAENLKKEGTEVTIIELSNHILSFLDKDMAAIVHDELRQKGVNLSLETQITAIEHQKDESIILTSDGRQIEADLIILGIGVVPEVDLAKKAGIKIGNKGGILVDSFLRTSKPYIYAVGDAIEFKHFVGGNSIVLPLAGPANKQGRIVAGNICGLKEKYEGGQGSGVLKVFDLTVASTGLTETNLKLLKRSFKSVILHGSSHAGYYPGAMPLTLKLIFSPSGEILGCQGVGYEGVDKRVDAISTAIRAKMNVARLAKTDFCYSPPYSSAKDPVNLVAFMALNVKNKLVKNFNFDDLLKIDHANSVLLDVRTKGEFKLGAIDNAINIPVDDLRNNLDKLPKKKKIYVYCATGIRSYIACRLLSQNGYGCFNLEGGYKSYEYLTGLGSFTVKSESIDMPSGQDLENKESESKMEKVTVKIDACGLMCPGPIKEVYNRITKLKEGQVMEVKATDQSFASDIRVWCDITGNSLLSVENMDGIILAKIKKGKDDHTRTVDSDCPHGKTIVVFSDDIDKVVAAFIIANGAAAMGRKMTMFFTFWGLNVLRKDGPVHVKKDFISKAFAFMMPRGSRRLQLSQFNMFGAGAGFIRMIMKKKNIGTLEELISQARSAGVELIACTTSMDIMGIKAEELIDGVKSGGVATFLGEAENADTSLFI